jgi:hypothetical protein
MKIISAFTCPGPAEIRDRILQFNGEFLIGDSRSPRGQAIETPLGLRNLTRGGDGPLPPDIRPGGLPDVPQQRHKHRRP